MQLLQPFEFTWLTSERGISYSFASQRAVSYLFARRSYLAAKLS